MDLREGLGGKASLSADESSPRAFPSSVRRRTAVILRALALAFDRDVETEIAPRRRLVIAIALAAVARKASTSPTGIGSISAGVVAVRTTLNLDPPKNLQRRAATQGRAPCGRLSAVACLASKRPRGSSPPMARQACHAREAPVSRPQGKEKSALEPLDETLDRPRVSAVRRERKTPWASRGERRPSRVRLRSRRAAPRSPSTRIRGGRYSHSMVAGGFDVTS